MTDALTDREAVSALRAIAHPVRLRILSLLTAEAMSAAEVARALDLTHANASYHLRVLHEAGELDLAGEEKVRGGTAKRYRYVADHRPAEGPPATGDDRVAYVRAIGTEVTRRVVDHAGGAGVFSDLETWVDPQDWDRVVALVSEASSILHDRARPRAEGTVHVSSTLFAFRMHDGAGEG